MIEHEALAVRLGHMSKWFTDQSYEATTLREAQAALAATPAVGEEPVEWHWRLLDDEGKPTSKWFVVDGPLENFKKDTRDDLCEFRPLYAAAPASLLRGREDLAPSPCSDLSIGELIEWLDNPQWTNGYLNSDAANHMSAAAELIERLVSSAPPEQPASPLRGISGCTLAVNMAIEACAKLVEETGLTNLANIARNIRALAYASPPEQPAADPVTERETIREIVYANAQTTLIGFNEISDQNVKFICDQISRKVELALSLSASKPRCSSGEPVWPNNDEANDLDKGSEA